MAATPLATFVCMWGEKGTCCPPSSKLDPIYDFSFMFSEHYSDTAFVEDWMRSDATTVASKWLPHEHKKTLAKKPRATHISQNYQEGRPSSAHGSHAQNIRKEEQEGHWTGSNRSAQPKCRVNEVRTRNIHHLSRSYERSTRTEDDEGACRPIHQQHQYSPSLDCGRSDIATR